MNRAFFNQQLEDANRSRVAPVLHIVPGKSSENDKSTRGKTEKKALLKFDTRPIFKAKKHDFL